MIIPFDGKLKDLTFRPKVGYRAIGLDLGNKLGFAYTDYIGAPKDITACGVIKLKEKETEAWGLRFHRLKEFLIHLEPDTIYYESVKQRFKSNKAALNYGGFAGILACWCLEHKIRCEGVNVGTVKKYMSGKGNAGKPMMIEAANKYFGFSFDVNNEAKYGDIADALGILSLGVATDKLAFKVPPDIRVKLNG